MGMRQLDGRAMNEPLFLDGRGRHSLLGNRSKSHLRVATGDSILAPSTPSYIHFSLPFLSSFFLCHLPSNLLQSYTTHPTLSRSSSITSLHSHRPPHHLLKWPRELKDSVRVSCLLVLLTAPTASQQLHLCLSGSSFTANSLARHRKCPLGSSRHDCQA